MTDYKLEVDNLKKEIKQLKADKDFVWTLWKRLQLSTPDVADAMSLVAQREKEKNIASLKELKDEILIKEEQIIKLNLFLDSKEKEIVLISKSKDEFAKRCQQLENQCSDLTEKASKLDRMLSKHDDRNQREIVTAYEHERKDLLNTISNLQSQMTLLRDEKNNLKLENVDYQEKINASEYLKESVNRLRVQLDDANAHIATQEETIQLLRDQLEQNIKFDQEDGYSSDRTAEYQSTRRRNLSVTESQSVVEDERPVTPIEDLNYKVDRLTLHMKHLQQCVASKENRQVSFLSRSRSTPPKRNPRNDGKIEESSRKIHYLTQKLTKAEALLNEEKKSCISATDILKKTNSKVKSMQLTIAQLRKQLEDNKTGEVEWKNIITRLENDLERSKIEIRNKEIDISRLNQTASFDGARIQDLLGILEKTRYELTEKKIASQEDCNDDSERLRSVIRQLETDKTSMEMKLSYMQSEVDNMKSSFDRNQARQNNGTKSSVKEGRNKRIKILSKKPKRLATRKIKSMQSILNHFSGVSGDCGHDSSNKDEEWEDDGDENEAEGDFDIATTDRTSDSKMSHASTGTRVARAASYNSRSRGAAKNCHRQSLAQQYHIYRINEARDRSPEKDIANSFCGQCKTSKDRVASLQQQLKAVVVSRDGCKSKMRNATRQLKICQSDLEQAKARCDRLVETIKKQCGRIQVLMEERNQLLGNDDHQTKQDRVWKDIGLDDSDVATIAKAHLEDITCQVSTVRELHQELSQREVQLVQLREKVNRLEREHSCKKKIIEDLRSKLQCLDGLKDRERNMADSHYKKTRDLEDSISRLKTQLESLQTRFNVILNERRKFEYEASNFGVKLEAAERKNCELRQAKQILETQLNKIDEEKDGKMVEIISKSDVALDRLSQQIQNYKIKCSKYENLVVNLARHLSEKSREIRRLIEFGHNTFRKFDSSEKKPVDNSLPGYNFARSKAADILSLSTSEIDSLLNGDRTIHDSARKMKIQRNNSSFDVKSDLSSQCKLMFKKDSFEQDIQTLFSDELDKIVEIVAPMSSDSGCISSS